MKKGIHPGWIISALVMTLLGILLLVSGFGVLVLIFYFALAGLCLWVGWATRHNRMRW